MLTRGDNNPPLVDRWQRVRIRYSRRFPWMVRELKQGVTQAVTEPTESPAARLFAGAGPEPARGAEIGGNAVRRLSDPAAADGELRSTLQAVLSVRQLRKAFGNHVAVADVSFEVARGEIFGLLGPNGAGKSTTMMMIAGLITPDSGEVRINGENFDPRRMEQRPWLGVVPQELAIYPELSAAENLRFFGQLYGLTGQPLHARIREVLDAIGLADTGRQPARTFSGGMQRRLNLGLALVHRPQLIILDEPTVGVDPQSRAHLLDQIQALAATGTAIVYASHYMEEVQALCRRVAIMDHGRVLACASLEQLLRGVAARLRLVVQAQPHEIATPLSEWSADCQPRTDGQCDVLLPGRPEIIGQSLPGVLERLSRLQIPVLRVETEESNLERLFLQLTGRTLRD